MRIPCDKLSVYVPKFLYPQAKAGHWETEKTGCKNADFCLYGTSHKTCFDVIPSVPKGIGIMFLHQKIWSVFLVRIVIITEKLSCGNFLCKKIAVAFFIARQKERNYQNEKTFITNDYHHHAI